MLTRDQGQRRISAVTIGLVAASVAGTVAVGAAAWAKETKDTRGATTGAATDGTNPASTASPATTAPGRASPGPVTPAPGATAPSAQPTAPANPDLTGPSGPVTGADGSGHASSGGS